MTEYNKGSEIQGAPPSYPQVAGCSPTVNPQYGGGPPGYSPAGYSQPQPALVTQVVAVPQLNYRGILRDVPSRVTCPFCQVDVVTVTTKKNGLVTWAACGGLAIFGCFLGCCLIPFCVDSLKNTVHDCPNCQRTIYVYQM